MARSLAAIEELTNLRLNGTAGWFVLELAVRQFSNNHFTFGRIFLSVPSFGPREGRNGLLEIWIPFTVGLGADRRARAVPPPSQSPLPPLCHTCAPRSAESLSILES
jgi:hypothetical protein